MNGEEMYEAAVALSDAINGETEASRGMVEAIQRATVAVERLGEAAEQLEHIDATINDPGRVVNYDHYRFDETGAGTLMANEMAAEVDREIINGIIAAPTRPIISGEDITSIQPMTGSTDYIGGDFISTGDWISPPNSTGAFGRVVSVAATDTVGAPIDPSEPYPESVAIESTPQSEPAAVPGGVGVSGFRAYDSTPIHWSSYNFFREASPITISKPKSKPKPIKNPKIVTRRVLNLAEEGWVVQ